MNTCTAGPGGSASKGIGAPVRTHADDDDLGRPALHAAAGRTTPTPRRRHTEGLLPATPGRRGAHVPPLQRGAGHVLYVEDNLVNIVLMQSIVALRQGLRMEVATSGDEGYARALADPPDLMLFDLRLPDCSGIELLQRLRAHPRFLATPAVIVSAEGFPENVRSAREAGFSDYWTKPLDIVQTLARLDAWLPRSPDEG